MKQVVTYNFGNIPGKLRASVRIIVDTKSVEYTSTFNGNSSTTLTLSPIINLGIVRASEIDENGNRARAPWNINDNLSMTKYTLPIFIEELKEMKAKMKTSELYTYQGKRLEINEEKAEEVRSPFMIGSMTVELSAVVITQDESRMEGVKMKFNNEQSSVLLTLNDLTSLIHIMSTIDIDSIAMLMYLNYISKPDKPKTFDASSFQTQIDIAPKTEFV